MIEQVKIWVRSIYGTFSAAVHSLREMSLHLHYQSGKIEDEAKRLRDPKQKAQDEAQAEEMRRRANHYTEAAERLEKDLEEAVRKQPSDQGPKI